MHLHAVAVLVSGVLLARRPRQHARQHAHGDVGGRQAVEDVERERERHHDGPVGGRQHAAGQPELLERPDEVRHDHLQRADVGEAGQVGERAGDDLLELRLVAAAREDGHDEGAGKVEDVDGDEEGVVRRQVVDQVELVVLRQVDRLDSGASLTDLVRLEHVEDEDAQVERARRHDQQQQVAHLLPQPDPRSPRHRPAARKHVRLAARLERSDVLERALEDRLTERIHQPHWHVVLAQQLLVVDQNVVLRYRDRRHFADGQLVEALLEFFEFFHRAQIEDVFRFVPHCRAASHQQHILEQRFLQFHHVRHQLLADTGGGRNKEDRAANEQPDTNGRQQEIEHLQPHVADVGRAFKLTGEAVLATAVVVKLAHPVHARYHLVADAFLLNERHFE